MKNKILNFYNLFSKQMDNNILSVKEELYLENLYEKNNKINPFTNECLISNLEVFETSELIKYFIENIYQITFNIKIIIPNIRRYQIEHILKYGCDLHTKIFLKKSLDKILTLVLKLDSFYISFEEKAKILTTLEMQFQKENNFETFKKLIQNIFDKYKYQIESYIYLLVLEKYIKELKSKEISNIDFMHIMFDDKQLPNFLIVLTNLILDRNYLITYENKNFNQLFNEINDFFIHDLNEYKFNLFELKKIGIQYIKDWMISKKINDKLIKETIEGKGLFYFISEKYEKINPNFKQKYTNLFYLYIGYAKSKNHFKLANECLKKVIKFPNDADENFFSSKYIKNSYKPMFEEFFGSIGTKFKSNKFISWSSSSEYNELNKELDKLFSSNKEIWNWFSNQIRDLLKINDKNINLDHNYALKAFIYTFYENKEIVSKEKLEYFITFYLTCHDDSICDKLKNRNFNRIPETEIKKYEKQIYIKSTYDRELAKTNIENIFSKFTNNYKDIDPISLVENGLLSIIDRFKFSHYEYLGDTIYNIIINQLKFECLIDTKIDLFAAKTQEVISNNIDFKNNIQKYNFVERKLIYKESSIADFFEVFIYFLYKLEGYQKTKEIVLELIKENYPEIIIKDKIKEQIDEDFIKERNRVNDIGFDLIQKVPKYYYKLFNENLKEQLFNRDIKKVEIYSKDSCNKIIKNIFKLHLKLQIIMEKEKYRCHHIDQIGQFDKRSFSEMLNLEIEDIFLKLKFIEGFDENHFFIKLSNLLEECFDTFSNATKNILLKTNEW